ncbi:MAG: Guanine nucleotide-binding protein subunit gamma [Ramalina farinacea]|uniref:Guanine nucleotide-binding protein subunit gamma n=1 Tax=Ramalina farinacea TaxID=258253 RepID=A0AA43QPD7_9LECA|nr:Guanine nucleotide-binding protein subunit gamma [Ramalina farinacea]
MPAAYEIRSQGDVKNKKQSMADLKLRRLNELNSRLREDLDRPRIKVSEASMSLIQYCTNTKDFMVPSMWGSVDKREDPYAPQQSNGCCTVM